MKRLTPIAVVLSLVLAACGSSREVTASTQLSIDPDRVVVTVVQSGGCMMMGPNCPTFVVYANAQVDLLRTGGPDAPVDSSIVDESLITELVTELGEVDLEALRQRLPAGECQGCVDGTDTTFVFLMPSGEVTFNSIDEMLDPSEALFANVWNIIDAAGRSLDMPIEQRS
jgi:hypothetical protein